MRVSSLKEQISDTDRVNVFVDGKYSFSLTIAEIIDNKVKIGKELDQADLDTLKKVSSDGKIRMRAYEWLMNRPHSTRELSDYLWRKKVESELIEKLVAEFTEKKVLSDERYTEWFTERAGRKHKSARMTQNELRGKGIQVKTGAMAGPGLDDLASLKSLIAKLSSRPRYSDQARLIRYLQGKGFSYADIKMALKLREPEQEP